jgi:hypothetical protein
LTVLLHTSEENLLVLNVLYRVNLPTAPAITMTTAKVRKLVRLFGADSTDTHLTLNSVWFRYEETSLE